MPSFSKKNHTEKVVGYQVVTAYALGIVSALFTFWQALFAVINQLIFAEFIQVDTRMHSMLYLPVVLGLAIIWFILHKYFVARWLTPSDSNGHHDAKDGDTVTPSDLSRSSSLQISMIFLGFILMAAILVFLSFFKGNIAPGDGHVVQNGMDSKSPINTLWIFIIVVQFAGSIYCVTHAVYLFDLYFIQFAKTHKVALS